MSAKLVGIALEVPGISATEKLLLVILADNTNAHTLRCDPSWASTAAKCCLSESGVRKVAKRLEDRGLLEVIHRPGTTNQYRVLPGDTLAGGLLPQSDRGGVTQSDRGSVTPGVTANRNEPENNRVDFNERARVAAVDRTREALTEGGHFWKPGGPDDGCAVCGILISTHGLQPSTTEEQPA